MIKFYQTLFLLLVLFFVNLILPSKSFAQTCTMTDEVGVGYAETCRDNPDPNIFFRAFCLGNQASVYSCPDPNGSCLRTDVSCSPNNCIVDPNGQPRCVTPTPTPILPTPTPIPTPVPEACNTYSWTGGGVFQVTPDLCN